MLIDHREPSCHLMAFWWFNDADRGVYAV